MASIENYTLEDLVADIIYWTYLIIKKTLEFIIDAIISIIAIIIGVIIGLILGWILFDD
ncbi:MAG: hypothetical protein HF976_01590, partial [ANME-2 cluster archaeon]|nr:hypothetical protein [ANME-2 cluster archaeon]MBC2700101.1 hypothetical protein [ANME-2 cluster archaeon]MBC2708801.1 hypothetical protein [ANME-2 cluster archaeon]MBC2748239.1 hypothetical protein [ANME-2 cluster archaeon]